MWTQYHVDYMAMYHFDLIKIVDSSSTLLIKQKTTCKKYNGVQK